ncbi:hypothetical protein [Spongiimicrobium sp. 2-473A-2-J]|uniref:hypothetical protein n=1 Tax=Eudoraea algarum TaxID=3417568 RepID=UPI003D36B495
MNNPKRGLLLLFCLFSLYATGQKCKTSSKMARKAAKHLTEEKIIKATKLQPIFSKFSQAAGATLIQSDKGFYLRLQLVRELGRRIHIMSDNPLVFQLTNEARVTLYPDRDHPGKFNLPATTEINRPFYRVTEEQLKELATSPIQYVKVYFTSDKVAEDKRGKDDLGIFFDYEILNDNFQSNLLEAAICMLQK